MSTRKRKHEVEEEELPSLTRDTTDEDEEYETPDAEYVSDSEDEERGRVPHSKRRKYSDVETSSLSSSTSRREYKGSSSSSQIDLSLPEAPSDPQDRTSSSPLLDYSSTRPSMSISPSLGFQADLSGSRSDNADFDGLTSTLARNQSRLTRPIEESHHDESRAPSQYSPDYRKAHEERMKLRTEIYQNSLLALSSRHTDFFRPKFSDLSAHQKLHKMVREDDPSIHSTSEGSEPILQGVVFAPSLSRPGGILDSEALNTLCMSTFACLRWAGDMATVIYKNCSRMQAARLANGIVSAIVMPNTGVPIVAMRTIRIRDIEMLIKYLADCASKLTENHRKHNLRELVIALVNLEHCCHRIMKSLIPSNDLLEDYVGALDAAFDTMPREALTRGTALFINKQLSFCRSTLERLDLAVLSYEGAHTPNLGASFNLQNESLITFSTLSNWETFADHPLGTPFPGCLRRLPLKCLAGLLGNRKIWVFCNDATFPVQDLYLKTDIETLADVWGPVWKVKQPHSHDLIAQYNVGNGSIIPWPEASGVHPVLAEHQRLCHWESNDDIVEWDKDCSNDSRCSSDINLGEDTSRSEAWEQPFDGTETLLIGAQKSPRLLWKSCHCSVDQLKRQLKEAGRVNHILASKSYQSVDSQQSSLLLGSHGIQVGRNKTYKTVREEPLKKSLLAAWQNEPQYQDPRELENFWGVAVSLCTMNARRVRLVELLGESSVLSLLHRFQWTDERPDGRSDKRWNLFKALQSSNPRALCELWEKQPTWREELGKALVMCLRILFKTGYDENRNEMNVFWLPSGSHSPKLVTLTPSDQKWVKFLKDTTYSVTVAVIIEDKLGDEPRCQDKPSDWFKTPSVLETAISVNRSLEPAPDLLKYPSWKDTGPWISRADGRSWNSIWLVSGLDSGKHIWVGPEDRLKIIRPLTKWHLLLEVDTVKRAILRDIIGLQPNERLSHWEYTDDEAESSDVRPIPVQIVGCS